MIWEYVTARWRFLGPEADEWPEGDAYRKALQAQIQQDRRDEEAARRKSPFLTTVNLGILWRPYVKSEEGDAMLGRYETWREAAEQGALNQYGAAGFELVSVMRHEVSRIVRHDHTVNLAEPEIEVHCYFKRQAFPDAPPAPTIGFQPPGVRGAYTAVDDSDAL